MATLPRCRWRNKRQPQGEGPGPAWRCLPVRIPCLSSGQVIRELLPLSHLPSPPRRSPEINATATATYSANFTVKAPPPHLPPVAVITSYTFTGEPQPGSPARAEAFSLDCPVTEGNTELVECPHGPLTPGATYRVTAVANLADGLGPSPRSDAVLLLMSGEILGQPSLALALHDVDAIWATVTPPVPTADGSFAWDGFSCTATPELGTPEPGVAAVTITTDCSVGEDVPCNICKFDRLLPGTRYSVVAVAIDAGHSTPETAPVVNDNTR